MKEHSEVVGLISWVTDAENSACTDRLNEAYLANITLEGMTRLLRNFGDSAAMVTLAERARAVFFYLSRCRRTMTFRICYL